jgi:histidinol-phosphatase
MSAPASLGDDLALARHLADEARAISLAMFRGRFGRRVKADGSIVTDADEAVERAIRRRLQAERPTDAMLGEEEGQTGGGHRRWIVDAIDGTHSFAAGGDQWGTLIALEIDGRIAVGVCDQVPIDRRYFAARGRGAFCAVGGAPPVRLAVSEAADLEQSRCFVPNNEWLPDAETRAQATALLAATRQPVPGDHPALLVAAGDFDLAVYFMGGPWDVAAPSIVVEEAGGRFSDRLGGTSIERGGGIFSNGRVHDAVLAVTARAGAQT